MNRKVAFIIIVVTLSLLIGGLIGFYFYTLRTNPGTTIFGQNPGRNFANYDPANPNQGNATTSPQDPSIIGTSTVPTVVPKLRKISVSPVAGFSFVNKDIFASSTRNIEPEDTSRTGGRVIAPQTPRIIGTEEKIRYVDRAYGHVFETSTSTLETVRLSNTTIPKIYEAAFVEKGNSIIFRNLIGSTDVIGTRYASLVKATTTDEGDTEMMTELKDLTANLLQVAVSPAKNQLFSIQKEGVTGFLSTPDGGAIQNILEIPFREWLVQWPEARTIVLTSKPSGFFPGYAYVLNPQNRSMTRILGGINGLTTSMSPDGNKLIYSRSDAGTFSLLSFDRRTGESFDLQTKTLPEKCVWANTEADTIYCAVPENIAFNTYPDVWYQGRITFSDSLWKLNIATREARLISRLQDEAKEIVDVQSMRISADDGYLLFDNKINLSLFGYQLKEPARPVFNPLDAVGTSTASSSANQ
ncbi:MAG TPA: hypothetical protein VGE62_03415 [Candidatus Paceibacterota bacterium]